jgi:beta-glucanase (GH16 family)
MWLLLLLLPPGTLRFDLDVFGGEVVSRLRAAIAVFVAVIMALSVASSLGSVASAADTTAEAEGMTIAPPSAGAALNDSTASGGRAVRMWWNSSLSVTGNMPASSKIVVVAKSQDCLGPASMTVKLDGQPVLTTSVKNWVWTTYTVAAPIAAGPHTISVSFTNDFDLLIFVCDRALYVDKVSIVPAAGPTDPPPTSGTCAQPPPSSTQPFSEEFNGPAGAAPNSQLWNQRLGVGYLEVQTNYPRNGSMDGNGNFAINALREPLNIPWFGWYQYTSASINTYGKFEMCYGTMRARIKLPNGKGIRPAFWLVGTDIERVGWPAAGEVDIIEAADRIVGSAAHGTGFNLATHAPFDVTGDWHEYWLRWERDRIVTGVDNQEIATYTPASLPPGASWPFNDHPMFLTIHLSVGGADQGGPPDNTTAFPATMLTDWVRYTPPA